MISNFSVTGLREGSVLYISANVAPDHPLRRAVVEHMDPLPDLDLNRLTRALGSGSRRYFATPVIDATVDPLPDDLSGYSGVIIGCSAYSVNPDRGSLKPWQRRLIDLIRRAIFEFKLPYLGICGGGQLGLTALGGRVRANPKGVGFTPETAGSLVIRTTNLELTAAGRADPIFHGCEPSFGMTAIHSDYLAEIPNRGFSVLANADDIPNQAIAFGDRVRLFGLHPEVSAGFLAETIAPIIEAGAFAVVSKEQLRDTFSAMCPDPRSNRRIIENFLTYFCSREWSS